MKQVGDLAGEFLTESQKKSLQDAFTSRGHQIKFTATGAIASGGKNPETYTTQELVNLFKGIRANSSKNIEGWRNIYLSAFLHTRGFFRFG